MRELAPAGLASRSHAKRARTAGPNNDDGGRSKWKTSTSRRRTHGRFHEIDLGIEMLLLGR
jgi:hypothetical protein